MSFSDSSQDYSQYVQTKVFQPFMNSLTVDGIEKRVEKLEHENIILDKYVKDLYKKMPKMQRKNSEINLSQSQFLAEIEFRLEKIEKLLSTQFTRQKPDQENHDSNMDPRSKALKQSVQDKFHVRHEDLSRLEDKLEKLIKSQAEDIAIDVTELEKSVKKVEAKLKEYCSRGGNVTRQEFHQLGKVLEKKIQLSTNLMDGVLSETKEIIAKANRISIKAMEKRKRRSTSRESNLPKSSRRDKSGKNTPEQQSIYRTYKQENPAKVSSPSVNKDLFIDSKTSKDYEHFKDKNASGDVRTCKASDANNLSMFGNSSMAQNINTSSDGMRSQLNKRSNYSKMPSEEKLSNISMNNYGSHDSEMLTRDLLRRSYDRYKDQDFPLPSNDDVYHLSSCQYYPDEPGRAVKRKHTERQKLKPSSVRLKKQMSNSRLNHSKCGPNTKDLHSSVKRVRDLTEKCLNGILKSSKNCHKSKKKRFKKSRSQPKVSKSRDKTAKNLDKLEQIYQDLVD
ncbi:unnamed protein product [Moneuplotes crassus]|uniref:Uncharacterized protein n=1 Tax=Euplotes crassus TaxID=5936 RepID=A0AAD1UBR8_EUPCR|nr:unnamed protein product [Moneuplotes crassus]